MILIRLLVASDWRTAPEVDGDGHSPVRQQAVTGGKKSFTIGSIESTAKTAGGLAQEAVAQAQLEARKPAEQDRGRVVARAPLEAKRRGYFSFSLVLADSRS